MAVPIVSESWCKEPKENEISLVCFVSGHPKLNVNLIKRYHELPDAKLTGRYSTPLLLHLWSQYIKQSVVTTTTEVEVLAPIAFGKSEMNKQNNTPKTGFRGNGSVTETLKNRVNKLSVMVPKEWRFSYFAELVNQNEINCDELEDFKVHMGKSMEYVKIGSKRFRQKEFVNSRIWNIKEQINTIGDTLFCKHGSRGVFVRQERKRNGRRRR